jgi:hypothetical protein
VTIADTPFGICYDRHATPEPAMPATLTIRDETLSGETLGEWNLDFLTETVTVRELIRSRVYQEVQDYNYKRADTFRGMVQPEGSEKLLNGDAKRAFKPIDWETQFATALAAFDNQAILILIDDHQVEELGEIVDIATTTKVSFLKLTPLVGG